METLNLFGKIKEAMIGVYGDYYFDKHDKDPGDTSKYRGVAQSTVGRMVLCGMYNSIMKEDELFLPLEKLEPSKKTFYWDLSAEFFQMSGDMTKDQITEKRIQYCKTMYVMDWITGTFEL